MAQGKLGIYLNIKELKAARSNSPYSIPSGRDWVFLTPEVNMSLVKIRDLAREKELVDEPDNIVWI